MPMRGDRLDKPPELQPRYGKKRMTSDLPIDGRKKLREAIMS